MASTSFKIEPNLNNQIKKEQDIYNYNEQLHEAMCLSEFNYLSRMNFKAKCESMSTICKAEVIDDSFSKDYISDSNVKLENSDQKNNNNSSAIVNPYLRSTDRSDYDEQKLDISEVTVLVGGVSSFYQEYSEAEIKIEKERTTTGCHSLFDPQTRQKVLLKELTIRLVDFRYNLELLNGEKHLNDNDDLTTNLAGPVSRKSSKTAICKNDLSPTKRKTNARRIRKRYDCLSCLRSFPEETNLRYHILSYHSDNQNLLRMIKKKTYDCLKCTKKFIAKYYLDRHVWSNHKDESSLKMISSKIYNCLSCSKNFFFKSRLDCHIINYHNDDRLLMKMVSSPIYDCPKCSKPFVVKADLKKHLTTVHNKNSKAALTPISGRNHCSKCNKQFSKKNGLDGHIIARHNDDQHLLNAISSKIHTCPKCSKRFIQKARLDYHIIKDHYNDRQLLDMISSKIYECLHCSKQFTNKCAITKHLTRRHYQ